MFQHYIFLYSHYKKVNALFIYIYIYAYLCNCAIHVGNLANNTGRGQNLPWKLRCLYSASHKTKRFLFVFLLSLRHPSMRSKIILLLFAPFQLSSQKIILWLKNVGGRGHTPPLHPPSYVYRAIQMYKKMAPLTFHGLICLPSFKSQTETWFVEAT